ncbi:MAG: hypothetical protein HGA22_12755, partial [Clostridiales bacterium]|nr:hypothetical protein [Clostridiales bacterium]
EDGPRGEPVPFEINKEAQTVTVYTDNLSVYGCFEVTDEYTRNAYAAYAVPAFATSQLKALDANAVITASVQNGGNPGKEAVEAGLSILDTTLAVGSAGVDTAAHIAGALGTGGGAAGASLLSGVSERLGDLGLLCSIAQVSNGMYNIYNGDKDAIFPCYANALKTGIGYVAGKMGASLFSLASIGTMAIDLSLNKFAESAWSGREDIYEKAYSLYYESPGAARSARSWARLFLDAKEGAASSDKYKARIEGLVQRYAEQFWQDETEVAAFQDEAQKLGFTGGGGLNKKMKQDISNRYRDELFRTVIQDAFKLIAEKEARVAERALLKQLNAIRAELNQTCSIKLTDISISEKIPVSDYSGATAIVTVSDKIKDAGDWSATLDSEGNGKISFTVLGYIMAGAPLELKLFKAASPQTGAPDMTIAFDPQKPVTLIELSSEERTEEETVTEGTVSEDAVPGETGIPAATNPPADSAKFAWVLVETINEDASEEVASTNSRGIYQDSASASPGSYTFSSKYIGETDTYPDPDQVSGEGYAMKLDFSVPPAIIHSGDIISLDFNLAFTAQNISYYDGTGGCRADLDNDRFINKDGKNFFKIYCSVKYSDKNVMSVSDTITAEAPSGSSPGDRIELWTGGLTAKLGTRYIYEWKLQ